jgi:hypothetical protein
VTIAEIADGRCLEVRALFGAPFAVTADLRLGGVAPIQFGRPQPACSIIQARTSLCSGRKLRPASLVVKRVRLWDEAGKIAGMKARCFQDYLSLLQRVVYRHLSAAAGT